MADKRVTITWLGHGTFLYQTPAGKRVLVDPWIDGNPKFPDGWRARLEELDGILLTHGHFDHVDSLATLAISTGAPSLCKESVSGVQQCGKRLLLPYSKDQSSPERRRHPMMLTVL